MITEKMLKRAVLILAGLILVLIFFFISHRDPAPASSNLPTVKQVIKQVVIDSIQFKKQETEKDKEIARLKGTVKDVRGTLKQSQGFSADLLNNAPVYLTGNADSAFLQGKIDQLLVAVHTSDSLCNVTVSAQDSVISATEEKYVAAQEFNQQLKQSFNTMAAIANAKDSEIKHWKKQTKKARAGNTVLKIVAVVAGVVAVKQSL